MQPLLPISARAFAHELSTLSKQYERAKKELAAAKDRHIQLLPNESIRIHNDLKGVVVSVQNAYETLKSVEEPKAKRNLLQKLTVLDRKLDLLLKEASLITFAEKDSPADLYTKLEDTIETLLFVVDPAYSIHQKIDAFMEHDGKDLLRLSGDSPRKIALLLLKLHKMTLEKLLSQMQENMTQHGQLLGIHEEINTKILDRKKHEFEFTPRYERSLTLKPLAAVEEARLQDLLTKLNTSSAKTVFKKPWKLFSCCRRETACETYGRQLSEEFGKKIPGLVMKLHALYTKVLSGKISPDQSNELSRKIDTYAVALDRFKKSLKEKRIAIYELDPDHAFKPLLHYGLNLRFMLSEAAILIDSLRRHSSKETVAAFKAIQKLAKNQKMNGAKDLVVEDKSPLFIAAAKGLGEPGL